MIATALTIAGSDSGGGAGIQADLKTFSALGVYGTSVVTALTAQNTRGVTAVLDTPPEMVAAQIDAVLGDIPIGAIKIGMLSNASIIATIADRLAYWGKGGVVLDPVMVATSGDRLLRPDAIMALTQRLFPLAAIVTPNLHEAAALLDSDMASDEPSMRAQGQAILPLGCAAVLVKGGHGEDAESVDVLVTPQGTTRFAAPRIATRNTHGTGCTLSAAIAAGIAKGLPLADAVGKAKDYVTAALKAGADLRIGHGPGPVQHFHAWWHA